MGEVRENVKRNLGYFLSLRGMSQKELAIKLDVSQSAGTNWKKGVVWVYDGANWKKAQTKTAIYDGTNWRK